jgi:hypothetical protein
MNERKWTVVFTIVNLIVINGFMIAFLNLKYPLVGHDYNLGIPSILDSALHFRLNGLKIQWFTPSFGGGIPAFPNPNNGQFSLVVLLATFLPPWQAVIFSTAAYISVGFVACEYFLRHTLNFHWTASQLGAVFFSANGFMMERVAVGHMGYFTFPLIALFLIALLDNSLSVKTSAALMGVLVGLLVHFAGYFILIVFALSILIVLPIVYILDPSLLSWKRFFSVLALGGAVGLLISISKLTAVYSFMRFFPRSVADHYQTPFLLGLFGLFLQLLGTMNLAPLFQVAGLNPDTIPNYILAATRADYGLWEMDMSITPVVFIVLLVGVDVFFHHPKQYLARILDGNRKFAFILLLLTIWVAIEFTLAKGFFYPVLRHLPILSSLHVNPRFAAAFIFPLAFVAALIFNKWTASQPASRLLPALSVINLLAVLPLGAFFLYRSDLHYRFYDIRQGQKIFEQIQSGDSFEVTAVGDTFDNTDAMLTRTSNLNLYEPAFGYELEDFHPQIQPGSVWSESDGYFNMTNPTGYVYPELNNNKPFTRFRVEDKQTLELFLKHIQPDWKIPAYQVVLNWVSGISFLIALGFLSVGLVKKQ